MMNDLMMHFHPDERPFIEKVTDWLNRVSRQHDVKRTDFLDPRQTYILEALVHRNGDVRLRLDGGFAEAERRRALITPEYIDPEKEPMDIQLLAIESTDHQFHSLTHGDFLGAILGLGIKRDKVGDIHAHDEFCHCLVAGEMIDYVRLHLQQVHRANVHCAILPLDRLEVKPHQLEEMSFTVASLRLDGVVSDAYRLSRAKVLAPIQSGKCRVNWKTEEDPSKQIKAGDVISLQGFGRFKVLEIEGITKKGRMRIRIGKYL